MNTLPIGPPLSEGGASGADGLETYLELELARSGSKRRYLLSCRFTKMMKLNLHLMHLCLATKKENGIFVSIDQPHSYTQMALKKMNTPQHGVIYIDAISKLTGMRSEDSQVHFLAGNFTLPILDDLFSRAFLPEGSQKHFVKLEDFGFILVNNVNVAMQYAGPEKVKRLLVGLTDMVKKYTSMKAFLIMDPASHPEMHDFLKTVCDREIVLKDGWL